MFKRIPYYVGIKDGTRTVFQCAKLPSETLTPEYAAVIGPFRTKQGARFMAQRGANNPHCQTVADAERLGKKYSR